MRTDSVHGLNLTVPEDARAVIKPWDKRNETDGYAESNVDDQVRSILWAWTSIIQAADSSFCVGFVGGHTYSLHRKRPYPRHTPKVRYVNNMPHEFLSYSPQYRSRGTYTAASTNLRKPHHHS